MLYLCIKDLESFQSPPTAGTGQQGYVHSVLRSLSEPRCARRQIRLFHRSAVQDTRAERRDAAPRSGDVPPCCPGTCGPQCGSGVAICLQNVLLVGTVRLCTCLSGCRFAVITLNATSLTWRSPALYQLSSLLLPRQPCLHSVGTGRQQISPTPSELTEIALCVASVLAYS